LGSAPPPAALPMMATDPADGYALLLDPVGSPNASQTWTFSNGSWTNLTSTAGTPPPGPSGADSVMSYDPALGAVIFFGGSFPGPGFSEATNETWEFVGGHWTDLNLSGPDFATGAVQTMAFDGVSNVLVDLVAPSYLYSVNGTPGYEDWAFTGSGWVNETSHLPATPPIGYDPLSEWDAGDGYLFYMAGGFDAQSWALGSTPLSAQVSVSPSPIDVGNTTIVTVLVAGGVPPIRFSYSGLPSGCVSSSMPVLVCQPTRAGNFTVTASVEDSSNVSVNASTSLQVGAALRAAGPLVSPAVAYLGSTVQFSVVASGGLPPYTYRWAVPWSGCIPPDAARFNCSLSPMGAGAISVTVTDTTSIAEAIAWGNLSVVARPVLASFTSSPSVTEVGLAFVLNSSVSGGALPLTYLYSGLPPGCPGGSSPTVRCDPTGAGTFNAALTVTDSLGTQLNATAIITVLAAVSIAEEGVSPNPAPIGSMVNFSYTAVGGQGPIHSQWTDLPPGCVPSQAAFGCMVDSNGSYEVGLTVRDALGAVARSNETLVVLPPGSTPDGSSPFDQIPIGTWAVVGLGVVALVGLVIWERNRRAEPSPPEPDTGVPIEGEEGTIDDAAPPPFSPESRGPAPESPR